MTPQRIPERVYELYEQRGHSEGHVDQDWLQAARNTGQAKNHKLLEAYVGELRLLQRLSNGSLALRSLGFMYDIEPTGHCSPVIFSEAGSLAFCTRITRLYKFSLEA